MRRTIATVVPAGLLVLLAGCATTATVADGSSRSGVFFGSFGVTGNGNTMTVRNGSRLTELSIIGDNNSILVEDQVTCPHVEFWGSNNSVSVPEYLMVRITEVGKNNRIIRRPVAWNAAGETGSYYAPPRTAQPTTAAPPAAEGAAPATVPLHEPPVEERYEVGGEGQP